MVSFIAANLSVFAAIYFVVGGLVFLAVLFLFYGAWLANKETQSAGDGFYPNHKSACLIVTSGGAILFGVLSAIFWPLCALALPAVFIYSLNR